MRKAYLITAVLLLSAVWAVAQTGSSSSSSQSPTTSTSPSTTGAQSTSPSSSYPQTSSPSSTSPSTSTTTTSTQTTETSSSSNANQTIEGCLSGSSGSFTLTDQSGKTYQLAGDTSKLTDHVGQQIRITGSEGTEAGESASASNPSSSSATSPSGSSATNPSSSAGSSSSSSSMGSSASSSQSKFNVEKVKMISSTCPAGTK